MEISYKEDIFFVLELGRYNKFPDQMIWAVFLINLTKYWVELEWVKEFDKSIMRSDVH